MPELCRYLWFSEGDLASIHTLAVAAQTLVHHAGAKVGKPSQAEIWVKAQPPAFQKRVRAAQNFFKHANTDSQQVLSYTPMLAEIYLVDAVSTYRAVYENITPLMVTFLMRFSVTHPEILLPQDCPIQFPQGIEVDDFVKLPRRDFLDIVLPVAAGRIRKRGFHLP